MELRVGKIREEDEQGMIHSEVRRSNASRIMVDTIRIINNQSTLSVPGNLGRYFESLIF